MSEKDIIGGGPTLFLDFDGVLHASDAGDPPESERDAPRPRHFQWAFELVRILAPRPDIRVVVHSSWRSHLSDRAILALLPWHLASRVDGCTARHLPREASIEEWIERARPSSFAILDDEPEQFSKLRAELIVCDPFAGVGDSLVQRRVSLWAREAPPA